MLPNIAAELDKCMKEGKEKTFRDRIDDADVKILGPDGSLINGKVPARRVYCLATMTQQREHYNGTDM